MEDMIKRDIFNRLRSWKVSPKRKPLLLWGARQVGKTFILKEFGRTSFDKFHYLNFEDNERLGEIFKGDLKTDRIIKDLKFSLNSDIDLEKDLLIFDEIQSSQEALTALKYFKENLPQLAICAAGSLLGLSLGEGSFPVGNVDILRLWPVTFKEFLAAIDDSRSLEFIENITPQTELTVTIHNHIWESFKSYLIVGGLPSVINTFMEYRSNSFEAYKNVREEQKTLNNSYLADVAKHAGKINSMHIERVWKGIPTQMSASVDTSIRRFRFSGVVPGISQYSRLVGPIDWLHSAGLIIRVPELSSVVNPLIGGVKENFFKLLFFDVGILGAIANLSPASILGYDFGTYKGYLAENFVAQELIATGFENLYSWRDNEAEIEFLIDSSVGAIPIEVKAGSVTRSKSLKSFVTKHSPKKSVILSGKGILDCKTGRYPHHLPLYLVSSGIRSVVS